MIFFLIRSDQNDLFRIRRETTEADKETNTDDTYKRLIFVYYMTLNLHLPIPYQHLTVKKIGGRILCV